MRLLCCLAVLMLALPTSAVTMDWVTVGDPGNRCDSAGEGCFGAVDYSYRISKYEVTNAQYTEFLNAVAASDPNGLYDVEMNGSYNGETGITSFGGISRSGSQGSYSYSAHAGLEMMPVIHVTFYDALRFVNWMHNGQPVGPQGSGTTENGAYTITLQGVGDNSITRNPSAAIFLPTSAESYKAAYYDPSSSSYFDYPTSSDAPPICGPPTSAPNHAHCDGPGYHPEELTAVGSYTGSASPYGTFDQGGNVFEWSETISRSSLREALGGAYNTDTGALASYSADSQREDPTFYDRSFGFRVAAPIPEPSTAILVSTGLIALAGRRRGCR